MHFQVLAFLKVGINSVVPMSSRAQLDFTVDTISHHLLPLSTKASTSLSTATKCNSNSYLLHQYVPPQLYPKSGRCFSTKNGKVNCVRGQLVQDLELAVVVKWTLGWRKWLTPPGLQAVSTEFPEPTIPMDAWICVTARLQRFSLSAGVNLNCLPKKRLGSSFHFQAQKSRFHLWVSQITKLLYVKLCIRSFLQTGTNLGNRAVSVYKSFYVCGRVLIMTVLWHFERQ